MEANSTSPAGSRELVTSLRRGMEVIEALSATTEPLSLADIARRCDTTRATARRLLLTLVQLDYVAMVGTSFVLRPGVLDLGDAYLASSRLPAIAHPHLQSLSVAVQDTCSLTILDGHDVVYVDRVKASRIMAVNIDVGTRFPAFATSTGRVLLAGKNPREVERYLADIDAQPLTAQTITSGRGLTEEISRARDDGYSIADQELSTGLRSIAVPILDPEERVAAALNVSTHVTRTSLHDLRARILPALLSAATAIHTDWSASPATT